MRIGSWSVRLVATGLLLACVSQVHAAVTSGAVAPASTASSGASASASSQAGAPQSTPAAAPAPAKSFRVKAEPAPATDAAPGSAPAKKTTGAATPKPAAKAAPVADLDPGPGQAWIRAFPGSRQTARSTRNFDEYWMPLGRLGGESQAEKVAVIGGKWTHAAYITAVGPSVAEVFRHYQQEVVKAGLELQYSCTGIECGEGGRKSNGDWWELSDNRRYLVAKLARPDGDLWVSVHVHARKPTAAVEQEIDVVEARPPVVPAAPRSEADVATLQKELKADGHVVLRQIQFVDGKATVLPASEPVVKAIADLMSRDPGLKLHVVAHSDDSDPWKASLDLSKKRAAAVTAMLRKFGVASSRVQASGVGPLAPIATNATGEGRAQNRRIELVPQGGGRAGGPAAAVRR